MTDMSNPSPNLDTSPPRVDPAYVMLPQCAECLQCVAYRGAHYDGKWHCLRCLEDAPLFTVQLPDGSLTKKRRADFKPDDRIVFDDGGPIEYNPEPMAWDFDEK